MNEGNDVFFFPPLYFPKLCNDIGCWRHLDALTSMAFFFYHRSQVAQLHMTGFDETGVILVLTASKFYKAH